MMIRRIPLMVRGACRQQKLKQPRLSLGVLQSTAGQHIHHVRFYSSSITSSAANETAKFEATTTLTTKDASVLVKEDFFGESVTIISNDGDMTNADVMLHAYDAHLVTVVTRGKAASGGGTEEGLPVRAAHAAAISWSELILLANAMTTDGKACLPMVGVLSVAPVLVQANMGYLEQVDHQIQSWTGPGDDEANALQLRGLATRAIQQSKESYFSRNLTHRELLHLQALDQLMHSDRKNALVTYQRLLLHHPGDALALSLAIELAYTIGDAKAAFQAATTVYSYWQDRQPTGHSIAAAWMAIGLCAGGRLNLAEGLLHSAAQPQVDLEDCSAVTAWARALLYDGEGRTAEGISFLYGYDGVKQYDQAGWLFHDSKLAGYGGRFALDRESPRSEARTILRVYDGAFDRVLAAIGQPRKAPMHVSDRMIKTPARSFLSKLFGGASTSSSTENPTTKSESLTDSFDLVDCLTWLPPTPQLLTDATNLLLRLTIHSAVVDGSDNRWKHLHAAWKPFSQNIHDLPMAAQVMACLVLHDDESIPSNTASEGAALLGRLLRLGSNDTEMENACPEDWERCVLLLAACHDEYCLDIDARPLLQIAVCHAALATTSPELLMMARSICSKGVCLRGHSPEEWFRYSLVLDALGDDVAAQNAKAASISMGAGEGGQGVH